MFRANQSGAKAYANIGTETGVASASPHKLIVMLFEGAMLAVVTAAQHLKQGNIAGKGECISRAITIIDSGLRASLDKEAGGILATNLEALYEYMSHRLLTANLQSDGAMLQEVYLLLKELKTAWEAIDPDKAAATQTQQSPASPPAPGYDVPRSAMSVKA